MTESIPTLSPEICHRLEVNCESCVRSRARSMARLSPGITDHTDGPRLFALLYPSPGCSPMQPRFLSDLRDSLELRLRVSTPLRARIS